MSKLMIYNLLKDIMKGCDGLVRKIEFNSFDSASIIVSVKKHSENKWINIKFHLDGLKEFSVRQKLNHSNTVISEGIAYMHLNNIHYIDFSPYSEIMDDENDFRMSDLYFASESITFEILPYE